MKFMVPPYFGFSVLGPGAGVGLGVGVGVGAGAGVGVGAGAGAGVGAVAVFGPQEANANAATINMLVTNQTSLFFIYRPLQYFARCLS